MVLELSEGDLTYLRELLEVEVIDLKQSLAEEGPAFQRELDHAESILAKLAPAEAEAA